MCNKVVVLLKGYIFPSFPSFEYSDKQGGGVGLYLRNDLTGEILGSADNGVCELLVVHIHQLNTVVAVAYRPPDTRLSEFTYILSKLPTSKIGILP